MSVFGYFSRGEFDREGEKGAGRVIICTVDSVYAESCFLTDLFHHLEVLQLILGDYYFLTRPALPERFRFGSLSVS